MDKFENQFETLDVQTAHMEDTMGNTTTLTTPQVISTVLLQPGKTAPEGTYEGRLSPSNNSNIESSNHTFLKLLFAGLVPRIKWTRCCMRWLMKQGEYGPYLQTI